MKIINKLALFDQHYYVGESQPPVHLHQGRDAFAVTGPAWTAVFVAGLCKYYHRVVKENELENVPEPGPIPGMCCFKRNR